MPRNCNFLKVKKVVLYNCYLKVNCLSYLCNNIRRVVPILWTVLNRVNSCFLLISLSTLTPGPQQQSSHGGTPNGQSHVQGSMASLHKLVLHQATSDYAGSQGVVLSGGGEVSAQLDGCDVVEVLGATAIPVSEPPTEIILIYKILSN